MKFKVSTMMMLVLLLFVILIAVVGCGESDQKQSDQQQSDQGSAKEELPKVKIGMIEPITGVNNLTGTWVMNGEKIAVDEINKNGGITVNGQQYLIQPFYYDSASTADGAVAAFQKLVNQDKIAAFIGTMVTDQTAAIMPIAEQHKIPLLSSAAAGDVLSNSGWKYFFRGGPYNEMSINSLTNVIANGLGAKKVHFVYTNDPWGKSYAKLFPPAFEAAGVKLVGSDAFNKGIGDFSALVTKIRSTNPDVVLLAAQTEDTVPFFQQIRQVLPKVLLMEVGGSIAESVLKEVPNLAPVVFGSRDGPETPETQKVAEEYRARHKEEANSFVYTGYDIVYMMAKAISESGTVTDGDKIREAFTKLDFTGLVGTYTPFKENGDNSLLGKTAIVTKDGKVARMFENDPNLVNAIKESLE
ncbi:MAG: ABC transporter substrate-binding protein [Bacillota bacterium]